MRLLQRTFTLLLLFCLAALTSCDNQIEAINPGPVPEAAFIYQVQTGTPGRVSFASTSTGHNQLAWDFGNGTFAYNQDAVTRNYTESGTYYVRLTAINVAGTSTFEDSVSIQIPPQLTAAFNVSFNNNDPLTVFITDNSQNADTYQWSFGDGNTSNSAEVDSYTYEGAGTYTVTLRTTRGEEQSPNFRITFTLINPDDLHAGSNKTWKFKTSGEDPSYFVERAGVFAFNYTLLSCEMNDRYIFNANNTFFNNNEGDARIIQEGGECRNVETPDISNFNFNRTGNSQLSIIIPGSYIGDIDSGPIYNIRSISPEELILSFQRPNPFNTAQTETVVIVLEPQL